MNIVSCGLMILAVLFKTLTLGKILLSCGGYGARHVCLFTGINWVPTGVREKYLSNNQHCVFRHNERSLPETTFILQMN